MRNTLAIFGIFNYWRACFFTDFIGDFPQFRSCSVRFFTLIFFCFKGAVCLHIYVVENDMRVDMPMVIVNGYWSFRSRLHSNWAIIIACSEVTSPGAKLWIMRSAPEKTFSSSFLRRSLRTSMPLYWHFYFLVHGEFFFHQLSWGKIPLKSIVLSSSFFVAQSTVLATFEWIFHIHDIFQHSLLKFCSFGNISIVLFICAIIMDIGRIFVKIQFSSADLFRRCFKCRLIF